MLEYYADTSNTVMKSAVIKILMTELYDVICEKIIYNLIYNLNIYVYI